MLLRVGETDPIGKDQRSTGGSGPNSRCLTRFSRYSRPTSPITA